MAIKNDGRLFGTGENLKGQLGLGGNTNKNVFTEISSGWMVDAYLDVGLPRFGGGYQHSLGINSDKALKSTGYNFTGQLSIGTSGVGTDRNTFNAISKSIPIREGIERWKYVVCGQYHTMAIKDV